MINIGDSADEIIHRMKQELHFLQVKYDVRSIHLSFNGVWYRRINYNKLYMLKSLPPLLLSRVPSLRKRYIGFKMAIYITPNLRHEKVVAALHDPLYAVRHEIQQAKFEKLKNTEKRFRKKRYVAIAEI